MKTINIITILGTRPEIIKLSPVIAILEKDIEISHQIIHTNQHYDHNMDEIFFDELHLPKAKYNLNVGSHSQAKQTALMLEKIETILISQKPDVVIVQGDTNTTLAGALATVKLHIPLIHIEAGCRSFNRLMPEEINRIVTDKISNVLIATDKFCQQNLLTDGINPKDIYLFGNTTDDAVNRNKEFTNDKILQKYLLNSGKYSLLTMHRAENTDNKKIIYGIVEAMNKIAQSEQIVFPMHPRIKKKCQEFNITFHKNITVIEPQGYLDFLSLMTNAKLIITDSGGIQEESAALNIPCLILRNETEWTRMVDAGKNIILTTNKDNILRRTKDLLSNPDKIQDMKERPAPFIPNTSEKIVDLIKQLYSLQ